MSTPFLFGLCVFIWGTTWFAITYQLGVVAPEVSVFYRFILAAAISFAYCVLRKKKLKFSKKEHFYLFGQGVFMFCLNYIFTYYAEKFVSSGLIAVTFTLMVYFNMVGMRLFFNQKIQKRVVFGGTLGFIGIVFLFYNEILNFKADGEGLKGLVLGVIAALFASGGNMFATKTRRLQLPILASNSWAMFYGSLTTGLICLLLGSRFGFSLEPKYLLSLGYLTILGTIVAFGAYIALVGRMGAEKAIFIGILTPVLALIISVLFESFSLSFQTFLGVVLCLVGNAIALVNFDKLRLKRFWQKA
ncbi:MAG: DMT family transporter [Oligoflexia bacterium]|nr:DMT family transporter [Oligoflexia bacterium]